MMLIVLDTTETFADLRMDGANYTLLRSFVSRNPVKLVVPQIVIEETVNHFRESLTGQMDRARSAIRSVKRLIPDASLNLAGDLSVEIECDKYRKHLKERLLLADQASYKDVDVTSLVQRALSRRKPFDSDGQVGFRDAVLWETVLQLAQNKPDEIVFITRNKGDFGEHRHLHEHLHADLAARELSDVKVTVCEGLGRFIDEHVKPSLEKLDEIKRKIDEGEFPGFDAVAFFDEWKMGIVDELQDRVRQVDLDRIASGSVEHYHSPSLGNTAASVEEYRVADVWRINEKELGIGIDYLLPGSIDCQQETCFCPHDRPYDEDHRGNVDFKLFMTVVIEEKTGSVVSWELNEIDIKATGDWGFPDDDD